MNLADVQGTTMVKQTVFDVTDKGEREIRVFMVNISGDAKLILPLFGNGYTLVEVAAKLPPSARAGFDKAVDKLLEAGYITAQIGVHPAVEKIQATPSPVPRSSFMHSVDEHLDLDFTGSYPVFTPDLSVSPQAKVPSGNLAIESADTRRLAEESAARIIAEQEASKARAENEALEHEIEIRSQQLASCKIEQFEQDMNNTITLMVEHALLQSEQEKLESQQEMVESARLSPMYESMRELAFFKDFSAAELAEVLHIGVWYEKEKHELIMQVGSVANSFFVLMSGSAAVLRQTKLIGSVENGESFGDGSYLMGEHTTHYANVIAKSHVEFLEFSTVELEKSSLEVRYQFARALARSQTRRFRRANEMIMSLLADKSHE